MNEVLKNGFNKDGGNSGEKLISALFVIYGGWMYIQDTFGNYL